MYVCLYVSVHVCVHVSVLVCVHVRGVIKKYQDCKCRNFVLLCMHLIFTMLI